MATKTLDERIVKTSGVCGGKPRIDGHRITVQNIVIWHDRLGLSADEISSEYDLELADIYTALAYCSVRSECCNVEATCAEASYQASFQLIVMLSKQRAPRPEARRNISSAFSRYDWIGGPCLLRARSFDSASLRSR